MANDIAILSAIKNCPAPYVRYWIDYHLSIGADHIFIYDNESTTPIESDRPEVTITLWKGAAPHIPVLNHGLKRLRAAGFKWVAIIDDDEFIVIPDQTLPEFLNDFEGFPGLGLNWLTFGTAGLKETVADGDVFAHFTRHIPGTAAVSKHVKCISRVSEVKAINSPHFCLYKRKLLRPFRKRLPVTENKEEFFGPFTVAPSHKRAWINHYQTRSEQDYFLRTIRGRCTVKDGVWYEEDFLRIVDRQSTEVYTRGKGKTV